MEMEQRLQHLLDVHTLPCGAIIDASGAVVSRVGDFTALDSAGLVSAMLGPYGSPEATYHLVQNPDQIKPVIWSQGSEFAFLDRSGEFVVVVFGRDRRDAKAQYELSRLVGESIATEFAGLTNRSS
jgi:hypothetical protein